MSTEEDGARSRIYIRVAHVYITFYYLYNLPEMIIRRENDNKNERIKEGGENANIGDVTFAVDSKRG